MPGADTLSADLRPDRNNISLRSVKLLLDNLPAALCSQRETLAHCLEAMDRVMPLRAVYLFGSHARGEGRPDSDVDLCIVADGAERQLEAARKFREAMGDVWPCPAFTLLPITPERLLEKQARKDHFFSTVLNQGVILASEN
jgi:predicted nucleotidyltransferase